MKKHEDDLSRLQQSELLQGLSAEQIETLLAQLGAREVAYKKGSLILQEGTTNPPAGLVLAGAVQIQKEDFWGARSILAKVESGGLFAETYSLASDTPMAVSVWAAEDCVCLFITLSRLLAPAPSPMPGAEALRRFAAEDKGRLRQCSAGKERALQQFPAEAASARDICLANLLRILAGKNLLLTGKINCITQRTTRQKVLTFLSEQSKKAGSDRFIVPFDRQQMADYLAVDRSALSATLSKLQKEGILAFRKNRFYLKAVEECDKM